MGRTAAMLAVLVVFLEAAPMSAVAAGANPPPTGTEARSETRAVPSLGFTLLAGLTRPVCRGNSSCDGAFGASPSLQALVLYQANETWAFGVVGQVERTHWTGTGFSMIDGTPFSEVNDLTGGFAGFAARAEPLPARVLTPVVQVALGWAFQLPGQFEVSCESRVVPGGQLALGGRARVSSSVSAFAMVSARAVIKHDQCFVFDAPTIPFAGWGFGFHAGASFDVALGHRPSETSVAAR